MKKQKRKGFHLLIPLHVYPLYIFVSIGEEDSVFSRGLKKAGFIDEIADDIAAKPFLGDGWFVYVEDAVSNIGVIRILTDSKDPSNLGIIAHECLHATMWVMRNVGIEVESEESFTYVQEYLTIKIFKKLLKGVE